VVLYSYLLSYLLINVNVERVNARNRMSVDVCDMFFFYQEVVFDSSSKLLVSFIKLIKNLLSLYLFVSGTLKKKMLGARVPVDGLQ
jgi:hypothetical protein